MDVASKRELVKSMSADTAMASTLLIGLLDAHGQDALSWSGSTVEMELKDSPGVDLSDVAMERLQALILALSTDRFHNDPAIFSRVCLALSGEAADFSTVESVDPESLAWGVVEVSLHLGAEPYSDDVRRFIGVCLEDHGLLKPPRCLSMADYRPGVLVAAESSASSDSNMYASWFSRNADTATDVDSWVASRIRELFRQIHAMPISNRDESTWGGIASKYLGVRY
jgi:hypothetical protein